MSAYFFKKYEKGRKNILTKIYTPLSSCVLLPSMLQINFLPRIKIQWLF